MGDAVLLRSIVSQQYPRMSVSAVIEFNEGRESAAHLSAFMIPEFKYNSLSPCAYDMLWVEKRPHKEQNLHYSTEINAAL